MLPLCGEFASERDRLRLLSPNRAWLRNICVSSCITRHLPAPLIRCALLIVVIFLYHGPVLLYPRIGPLLLWVLHSCMTLLLHLQYNTIQIKFITRARSHRNVNLRRVMLQGISSSSLRSLKTYFYQP